MRFKLVLFDLDGTLLDSKRNVHPANLAAIEKLKAAGVWVAFATGRPPGSTKAFVDVVKPNAPLVHYNGAMVRDAYTGAVHFHRSLTVETAVNALHASDEHALHANVYVGEEIWIERTSPTSKTSEVKDGVAHTVLPDLRVRLRALPGPHGPTKVMLITHPERIPTLTERVAGVVGAHASLVNSEPEYLEVLPPAVSKKTAAEALCEHLGIALSDVVAFGDNLNDLELLENAGLGVAMGNSHATVLARVKTHIGHNDTDAIAQFLATVL